jgi:polysaccharide export outer membrane protein
MNGRIPYLHRYLLRSAVLLVTLHVVPFSSPPIASAEYVIGEGDTMMVSVWGEKDLSQTVKVRPDGKITLPAVGEMMASGMTPKDLQKELIGKMRGIVKNPVVTVIMTEMTNNKVYIFGGGVQSGVYSLNQRTTLLQLLCQMGQQTGKRQTQDSPLGLLDADLHNAYVIRDGQKIRQDFYDLVVNAKLSQDIVIEPNDTIFIPAFRDRNVYIMGAVARPKAIAYREGLTVVEAILEAGGFTKYAKENATVIYRKNGEQEITIPVRVKDLMNDGDLRQNTALRPGDYVIVNESLF